MGITYWSYSWERKQ